MKRYLSHKHGIQRIEDFRNLLIPQSHHATPLISEPPRFAVYVRCPDHCIQSQIDECETVVIEQLAGTVVGTYIDHGHSSSSMDRAGLHALKADALTCNFDAIICRSMDRLRRLTDHVAALTDYFHNVCGVELYFVNSFSEEI